MLPARSGSFLRWWDVPLPEGHSWGECRSGQGSRVLRPKVDLRLMLLVENTRFPLAKSLEELVSQCHPEMWENPTYKNPGRGIHKHQFRTINGAGPCRFLLYSWLRQELAFWRGQWPPIDPQLTSQYSPFFQVTSPRNSLRGSCQHVLRRQKNHPLSCQSHRKSMKIIDTTVFLRSSIASSQLLEGTSPLMAWSPLERWNHVEPLQPRGDGKVVVIKEESRWGSGDRDDSGRSLMAKGGKCM